jgi:hypothetical protein
MEIDMTIVYFIGGGVLMFCVMMFAFSFDWREQRKNKNMPDFPEDVPPLGGSGINKDGVIF